MAEIDIAQEWRRLQELYGGMAEEELEEVADQGYELTDIAKQVLHAEIARRHLKVIVRLSPPEPEAEAEGDPGFDPANLDLGAAGSVDTQQQAAWVKKTLNDAGIPCYFGPDLLEDVHRVKFIPDKPVDVMVLKHDQPRVSQVLAYFQEKYPSPPKPEPVEFVIHCPKCNSTEVMLLGPENDSSEGHEQDEDSEAVDGRSDRDPETARDVVGTRFIWSCDACGHQWQDDGIGERI